MSLWQDRISHRAPAQLACQKFGIFVLENYPQNHASVVPSTIGPEIWEIKSLTVWRKTSDKLPSTPQTLIFARNVRTGEIKFFLSNRVVGEKGVILLWLLRVAFGRWVIEACFRLAKEELDRQSYYQKRNATAKKSHTKTRIKFYHNLGIDVQEIKSCIT